MLRFALLLAAGLISGTAWAADDFLGQVLNVSDGDTFTMKTDARTLRVRLCGMDAPERGQAGYGAAAGALASLIEGKTVHCLQVGLGTPCDGRSKSMNRDRIVAQCFSGDKDVSMEMVRSGTACDWPKFSGGYYRIDKTSCSR